jgi:nitrite reductase/ring-hydroxylating ferredoxin subunit
MAAQVVGLSAELGLRGDYLTQRVGDTPVLLWRGEGGTLGAYINTCAHRAARVASAAGNAATLRCPLHGWVYRDDGWLESVPTGQGQDELPRSQYGLVPLPCREEHGLIWLEPSPDPNPGTNRAVGEHASDLGAELDALELIHLARVETWRASLSLDWSEGRRILAEGADAHLLQMAGAALESPPSPTAHFAYGRHQRISHASPAPEALRTSRKAPEKPSARIPLIYSFFPSTWLASCSSGLVLVRLEPESEPGASELRCTLFERESESAQARRIEAETHFEALVAALS